MVIAITAVSYKQLFPKELSKLGQSHNYDNYDLQPITTTARVATRALWQLLIGFNQVLHQEVNNK